MGYDDLKTFADANLGPTCGPANLDLCSDADKALIKKFQKRDADELEMGIEEGDEKVKKITAKYTASAQKLQDKITDLNQQMDMENKKRDAAIETEKTNLDLGMMKAVLAAR